MRSLIVLLLVAVSVEARPPQSPKLPQVMLPARATCDCLGSTFLCDGCGVDCACGPKATDCKVVAEDLWVLGDDGKARPLSAYRGDVNEERARRAARPKAVIEQWTRPTSLRGSPTYYYSVGSGVPRMGAMAGCSSGG